MNQRGNALVYTVLAIAAILSTILIVSNLMIGEVRQAGNFDNMAKAAYAAESAAEWGVFNLRKNDVMLENDCEMLDVECYVETDETAVKKVQADLPANKTLQIDLYNPIKLSAPAGVESMKIGWVGAGWIEVSFVEWPAGPADGGAGAQVNWNNNSVQKFLYSAGSVLNVFQANKNYIVRLKALNAPAVLAVEIFPSDNAAGGALPFPQFVRVAAEGTFGGVTQKLNIDLPKKTPLMGLFDYVLFSEESIMK
jgi:hypothetical protein